MVVILNPFKVVVSDLVMSPDGHWMWTGSEWIPAPPVNKPDNKIDQDLVSFSKNIIKL